MTDQLNLLTQHPEGIRSMTVAVLCVDGRTVTVKAHGTGVPGLVVTPWHVSDCDPLFGMWTVTHRASGYRVGDGAFATLKAARAAAKRLASLTDWTQPAGVIAQSGIHRGQVDTVIQAAEEAQWA